MTSAQKALAASLLALASSVALAQGKSPGTSKLHDRLYGPAQQQEPSSSRARLDKAATEDARKQPSESAADWYRRQQQREQAASKKAGSEPFGGRPLIDTRAN
jgi:hypothetical protein